MDLEIRLSAAASKMLQAIEHAATTDLLTAAEMQAARRDVGKYIIRRVKVYGFSKFKNPTGALAGSFTMAETSRSIEVGSDLPYSRRREFGFTDRTDSLGRTYHNDPGQIYLMDAITDAYPYIGQRMVMGLSALFARVMGGA